MSRRTAIRLFALVWLTFQVAFFWWLEAALRKQADWVALAAAAALGLLLLAVATGRGLPLRWLARLTYAAWLVWSLVNFVYFRMFSEYVTPFSSRLANVNAGSLRLLMDYRELVPRSMWLAALALGLGFLAVTIAWRHESHRPVRQALLFKKQPLPLTYRDTHLPGLVPGLLRQSALLALLVGTWFSLQAPGWQARLVSGGLTERLGIVSSVFASQAPAQPDGLAEGVAAPAAESGLSMAKTNAELLRDTLASLSPVSSSTTDRVIAWPLDRPHVIMYQLESVPSWALELDPTPMPFLASLMRDRASVPNYFANGCTTIDAEFAVNCGVTPESYGPVSDLYSGNRYRCLPSILQERGYDTALYHANDDSFWARDLLGPSWGFERLAFSPEFDYRAPDQVLLDRVVDDLAAATSPQYAYVIGILSHGPHNKHFQDYYNRAYELGITPYTGPLSAAAKSIDTDEATTRLYLGFLKAVDDGLQRFFGRLQMSGMADRTVVAIFADHRYYRAEDADPMTNFLSFNRLPFALVVPGLSSGELAPVASHLDLAPTINALTGGQASDLPASFAGTSLLTAGHRDFAVTKCLGKVTAFDGQSLISGNVRTGQFEVTAGAAKDGATGLLRRVTLLGDLLLQRDELGAAGSAPKTTQAYSTVDTDGDGLSDLREAGLGTWYNKTDSDGDGVNDGDEVKAGTNPLGEGRWMRGEGATLGDAPATTAAGR